MKNWHEESKTRGTSAFSNETFAAALQATNGMVPLENYHPNDKRHYIVPFDNIQSDNDNNCIDNYVKDT